MSKIRKIILSVLACIPILLVIYIAFVVHFTNVFLCGTWINDVYCTGFTVEDCNRLLLEGHDRDYLEIEDMSHIRYRISYEEIEASVDFTQDILSIKEQQNPYLWIVQLFYPQKYTIEPTIRYNKNLLSQTLKSYPGLASVPESQLDVLIVEGDNGYRLQDNRKDYLDMDKVITAVEDALYNGDNMLDLVALNCYTDLGYTKEMEETLALWEKVDAYQNSCRIVYDMGDKTVPVDASVVCHFIKLNEDKSFVLDEDGELVFDKDGVTEFINELAAEYDTYGKERSFVTTAGDEITIKGGTFGSTLNQKAEVKYLTNAFLKGLEEVHTPSYSRKSPNPGKDVDIGDTYVEIDMTNQMMYYYEDGVLELETEVVTGNLSKNHDTPEGINYVYLKQKNRILRGPGYASFVNYWMPVKGGIGIHDATWRDKFGGEIYKTDGSHGCINTPLEKMEELYDMVDVGTPVVMYY